MLKNEKVKKIVEMAIKSTLRECGILQSEFISLCMEYSYY
jgi:hypothetical protein